MSCICTCPCDWPPLPPSWTDNGTMRIRTYEARNALPIIGVEVKITALVSGVVVFDKTVTTDEDGVFGPFTVPCPDRALSLEEFPSEQPYATYNLVCTHPNYNKHTIAGSMVFGGQETLEEIAMIPAEEEIYSKARYNNIPDDNVIVPTHKLYGEGGKTGSTPNNVFVLNRVVIPEKITVHLGKPAASARDVTVSFKDYIKNVASSEVYPTWPEQSLRANIHAQISLALNRIYTEWYPSRGYPFNITNSTSYDQYYVHGREIFDSMSKIVDDIFNTYVRKTGTVNPYYTEYCDGKTVSCKGMKQWGTVTLANQGKNALQILKYYYGNDIEIIRTNNIEAIPQSYPGTPLKLGDTGTNVRIMQRQLNRITKDYPFFGLLTVNGVFDSATQSTVKKFQKQFSLTQDGVVGRATWYKISYIYVSVKDLAELTSEGELPDGELVEGAYPGTPLKRGSRGDNVSQIQFWLNTVGEFNSAIPAVTVDGIFGAGTETAVKAFQDANGLTVDGIVGKTTWNTLFDAYSSVQDDISNGVGQWPGKTIKQGDKGDDVKRIQFFIRIISRSNSSVPNVSIDGIFGPATTEAVRKFQSAYGLTVDGLVGKATWNSLYEVYTDLINGLLSASQRPGTYPGTPLKAGSSGQSVKEMQYYLYILSAYYKDIPQISFDGKFGPATTQAVIAFQKIFGLTPDGIVGENTWSTLYNQFKKLRNTDGLVYAFKPFIYPGEPIGSGSPTNYIKTVQYMLLYIGVWLQSVLPVEINGVYDEQTTWSVESYQSLFSLPQTGIVDEITWSSMALTFLSLASDTGTTPDDGSYPGFVLIFGSTGAAVRQLQKYINEIAVRYIGTDFIINTGVFESTTLSAVLDFQKAFGLPITGAVDKETWDLIRDFSLREA